MYHGLPGNVTSAAAVRCGVGPNCRPGNSEGDRALTAETAAVTAVQCGLETN